MAANVGFYLRIKHMVVKTAAFTTNALAYPAAAALVVNYFHIQLEVHAETGLAAILPWGYFKQGGHTAF